MTKVFGCLSGRFRHDPDEKLPDAFEAVCVICQLKLENETPLYDVLIQAVLDTVEEESDDAEDDDGEEQ
jgi:hypothetical protein